MACLAEHFRQTSQDKTGLEYLLPVDGTCPVCDFHCLWGDIIKKKKGAFYNCFALIIRIKEKNVYKEVHIKIFNTGKFVK